MTVSSRDQRALIVLAVVAVIFLIVWLLPEDGGQAEVVKASGSIPAAEQRLARVRQLAAQVPAKEKELERLSAELAEWENGLIRTETAQQAQAELLQILRRLGNAQAPPLEFRAVEIGQVRPLGKGKNYGEALVSISFTCAIEQLVNLLADLTAGPEAIATEEIRISTGNQEQKTLSVRLTVAALVPHELVPERRGLATF
jgi:nitrate/nitrite-specific signal transduction histidine kinase